MASRDIQTLPAGFILRDGFLDFEGLGDAHHPQNWTLSRRVWATFMLSLFNLVVTISSSIFSGAQESIIQEYGANNEIAILGTSLFLVVSVALFRLAPVSSHNGNMTGRAMLLVPWCLGQCRRGSDGSTP